MPACPLTSGCVTLAPTLPVSPFVHLQREDCNSFCSQRCCGNYRSVCELPPGKHSGVRAPAGSYGAQVEMTARKRPGSRREQVFDTRALLIHGCPANCPARRRSGHRTLLRLSLWAGTRDGRPGAPPRLRSDVTRDLVSKPAWAVGPCLMHAGRGQRSLRSWLAGRLRVLTAWRLTPRSSSEAGGSCPVPVSNPGRHALAFPDAQWAVQVSAIRRGEGTSVVKNGRQGPRGVRGSHRQVTASTVL